jgi:DNA-directed RNA polymerase specialized sigma24 family protein
MECTSKISISLNKLYANYLKDPATGLEPLIAKVRSVAKRTFHDDDMSQQFALATWQSLPGLKDDPPSCSFGGWVYRRIQWRHVDYIRASKSAEDQVPEMMDDDGNPMTDEEALDLLTFEAMQDAGPGLDTRLEDIDNPFAAQVARLLIVGYTQDEIAKEMKIKPATLRKRLERFRQGNDNDDEVLAA